MLEGSCLLLTPLSQAVKLFAGLLQPCSPALPLSQLGREEERAGGGGGQGKGEGRG